MYFPSFTLRRILFTWTAVFLVDYPIFQIQVFLLCSIVYSLYLLGVRPFRTDLENNVEIVNEIAVFTFAVGLFPLTPLVTDSGVRYLIGWVLIGLTCSAMVFNLLVILFTTGKDLISFMTKFKMKRESFHSQILVADEY